MHNNSLKSFAIVLLIWNLFILDKKNWLNLKELAHFFYFEFDVLPEGTIPFP